MKKMKKFLTERQWPELELSGGCQPDPDLPAVETPKPIIG
jgi:hypothetical protein